MSPLKYPHVSVGENDEVTKTTLAPGVTLEAGASIAVDLYGHWSKENPVNIHNRAVVEALSGLETRRWVERELPAQMVALADDLAHSRLVWAEGLLPSYAQSPADNLPVARDPKDPSMLFLQGGFPDMKYRILIDGTLQVDRWLLSGFASPELHARVKLLGFSLWG